MGYYVYYLYRDWKVILNYNTRNRGKKQLSKSGRKKNFVNPKRGNCQRKPTAKVTAHEENFEAAPSAAGIQAAASTSAPQPHPTGQPGEKTHKNPRLTT